MITQQGTNGTTNKTNSSDGAHGHTKHTSKHVDMQEPRRTCKSRRPYNDVSINLADAHPCALAIVQWVGCVRTM